MCFFRSEQGSPGVLERPLGGEDAVASGIPIQKIYIYIYIERERDVYIYIYIYIYRERERDVYIYIYIYTYTHTYALVRVLRVASCGSVFLLSLVC